MRLIDPAETSGVAVCHAKDLSDSTGSEDGLSEGGRRRLSSSVT